MNAEPSRWRQLLALVLIPCALGQAFGACRSGPPIRPAAYGTELAACQQTSLSWDEYEPCCVDVAKRYGRDPAFCFRGGE